MMSWCLCVFTCSSSLDSHIQDGATALIVASQEGHHEIVRMLLEAKADVNMKDNVSESCYSDGICVPASPALLTVCTNYLQCNVITTTAVCTCIS